jgi:hypothetical protein
VNEPNYREMMAATYQWGGNHFLPQAQWKRYYVSNPAECNFFLREKFDTVTGLRPHLSVPSIPKVVMLIMFVNFTGISLIVSCVAGNSMLSDLSRRTLRISL